ncbi:HIT family protein [Leeia sp. TBRC 13508]|uniref:HIT family protein n=1 Tax=Leeia speluncae TaxID=2884804 RepID=A0ABS8D5J4_9NEIS|nr:HIT family protein [Leeia speluncae]MCB6183473.1 HIT family protein [Leeia speluncae]
MNACELCSESGGQIVFKHPLWRVVLVDDPLYAGFCRVIWADHVKEMTDLPLSERNMLMNVVWTVESVIRDVLQPTKINLASLGNMTPHLHWHVIPRWEGDAHFPAPVWATQQREPKQITSAQLSTLVDQLKQALAALNEV